MHLLEETAVKHKILKKLHIFGFTFLIATHGKQKIILSVESSAREDKAEENERVELKISSSRAQGQLCWIAAQAVSSEPDRRKKIKAVNFLRTYFDPFEVGCFFFIMIIFFIPLRLLSFSNM